VATERISKRQQKNEEDNSFIRLSDLPIEMNKWILSLIE
jgi:hypothetical protein